MGGRRVTGSNTGRAYPLLIGLAALGLAGYFSAWTPHRAAGLVITGLDLAEFVKFLPQVASGQISVQREIFYLPLAAGSLIASLFAARRGLPRWLRLLLGFAAIPLALAMLPPAWSLATVRQPEFRAQVIMLAGCLAFLPLAQLIFRSVPRSLTLLLAAPLALAAAVGPASEFLKVHFALEEVYHTALSLGWGFWVNTIGLLAFALLALATALRGRPVRG